MKGLSGDEAIAFTRAVIPATLDKANPKCQAQIAFVRQFRPRACLDGEAGGQGGGKAPPDS